METSDNKTKTQMRIHFEDLFEVEEREIKPRVDIEIRGVRLEPGKKYGDGVQATGIDLLKHRKCYFDAEKKDGVYVIRTIYD
jgi:hypothetical protein